MYNSWQMEFICLPRLKQKTMKKIIRAFTVFSGYDSQFMALMLLSMDHPKYKFVLVGWCEIDKSAIRSHNAVFPEYENCHYNDVTEIDWNNVPDFDLLFYSSCCQSVSRTGACEGMEKGSGTESSLIWFVLEAIRIKKPKICVLENVKNMVSKTFMPSFINWQRSVDELGYYSRAKVLNASDYDVPQNRERIFMVSVRNDIKGYFDFPKPMEQKHNIEDLLERNVDEKYYFPQDEVIRYFISLNGLQVDFDIKVPSPEGGKLKYQKASLTCKGHGTQDAAKPVLPTLKATGYNSFTHKNCHSSGYFCQPAIIEVYDGGVLNCIPNYCKIIPPMNKTIKDEIGNCSKETLREIPMNLLPGQYIRLRRMTPTELFRFMGVPSKYIEKLVNNSGNTDAELYKQAGNSIVVDVLYHLFKNIFDCYYNQIININYKTI